MCFVWISEQTAIISLYGINLSVFKTEAESVYCAVRTGPLNQTNTVSYLKGKTIFFSGNKLPSTHLQTTRPLRLIIFMNYYIFSTYNYKNFVLLVSSFKQFGHWVTLLVPNCASAIHKLNFDTIDTRETGYNMWRECLAIDYQRLWSNIPQLAEEIMADR